MLSRSFNSLLDQTRIFHRMSLMEAIRDVKAEILYHLPDKPGLVQTYLHPVGLDTIVPGQDLLAEMQLIEHDLKKIRTKEEFDRIEERLDGLKSGLKEHLDRLGSTAQSFTVPFQQAVSAHQRRDMIHAVPFSALREFLGFWEDNIDGPMREVRVMASVLPHDRRDYGLSALVLH